MTKGDPYRRDIGPEIWTFIGWDFPRDRLLFENSENERLEMPRKVAQARGMWP